MSWENTKHYDQRNNEYTKQIGTENITEMVRQCIMNGRKTSILLSADNRSDTGNRLEEGKGVDQDKQTEGITNEVRMQQV